MELCTRLARFKKENKELLTYLLFEAHDEQAYVDGVKAAVDVAFDDIRSQRRSLLGGVNLYLVKKSLRKTLRLVNKHIRFSGSKHVEVQLLMHFLAALNDSGVGYKKNAVLVNLYKQQLKKIEKAANTLHEDLQHDYANGLQRLRDAL